MENGTWTFFCRDGGYDDSFRPIFRRYVCHDAAVSLKTGADGEGVGRNRLTLWIRDRHTCLLDENGGFRTMEEADIRPGDRIAAGEQTDCGAMPFWRITGVTAPVGGIGLGRGWTITAE